MMNLNNMKSIRPYIEKRPLSSYSQEVLDNIHLISINQDKSEPFGSAVYRIQKYPGDVDVYEIYESNKSIKQLAKDFVSSLKKIVKDIKKNKLHYYSEVKAGIDERYDIDIGKLENNIFYINPDLHSIVEIYYFRKLITKEEYNIIINILNKNTKLDSTDYEIIYNIFRKYRVLRWSSDEIIKGIKKLPNNKKISLNDALLDKTFVKIDMIAVINNKFVEVTNFFILVKKNNVTGNFETINLDYDFINYDDRMAQQDTGLRKEIEKLYFSNTYYSPFKMLKRIYALARSRGDIYTLNKVIPFVSSNASLLYQIKSELDAIMIVLERSISKPIKTINYSLDNLKNRIASVIEIPNNELIEINELINLSIKTNKLPQKINILKELKNILIQVINALTINYLNKIGFNPPPLEYLPNKESYNYLLKRNSNE